MKALFHFFDQRPVMQVGVVVMVFLLGMAVGNGHKTEDALKGQAQYFQTQEKRHVEVQKKLDAKVIDKAVTKAYVQGAIDANALPR